MEAQDLLLRLLASGLTQVAISSATDIPQPTLSRLARGVTKDLPSRRVRRLQELLESRAAEPAQCLSAASHETGPEVSNG